MKCAIGEAKGDKEKGNGIVSHFQKGGDKDKIERQLFENRSAEKGKKRE